MLMLVLLTRQVTKSSSAAGLSRVSRYTFLTQSLIDAIAFVGVRIYASLYACDLTYNHTNQAYHIGSPSRWQTLACSAGSCWIRMHSIYIRSGTLPTILSLLIPESLFVRVAILCLNWANSSTRRHCTS